MGFVTKIHSHFISPQRVAMLTRIQKENEKPIKKLKKYIKTRWLSFGISLERLLEIWDSLKLYVKEALKKKNKDTIEKQLNNFGKQLDDPFLHLQLKYIAYVIGKTNTFNQIFQNQSLPIEKLKTTLVTAYKTILRLCISLEKITNENIKQFIPLIGKMNLSKRNGFLTMKALLKCLQNFQA